MIENNDIGVFFARFLLKYFQADKMIIEKTYKREDLIANPIQIEKRCQLIEDISVEFDFIPETHFQIKDDVIVYRQEKLNKQSYLYKSAEDKYKYLKKFADDMDLLSETGFVHGDIKVSNVMFADEKLWLIDLEPSLRQRRDGRVTLIYTPPYISLNDLEKGVLTSETDKLGYYFFIQRFFEPSFRIKDVETIMKQRIFNKIELLPIPERTLFSMNYNEILAYVLKHYWF